MEDAIDLDVAALEIERRTEGWRRAGLTASAPTWRDQGAGWPPPLLTDRTLVRDPDSLGVALRKGDQEGQAILFNGGWCDVSFWSGAADDDVVEETVGFDEPLTVERFGVVLDRLVSRFG